MQKVRNLSRRPTTLTLLTLAWLAQPLGVAYSAAMADAPSTYQARCASCHGMDGAGTAAGKKMGVRDFASPEVAKQTDGQLNEAIAKGRKKMPGYAKSLKPEEITGQVAFVRAFAKGK